MTDKERISILQAALLECKITMETELSRLPLYMRPTSHMVRLIAVSQRAIDRTRRS